MFQKTNFQIKKLYLLFSLILFIITVTNAQIIIPTGTKTELNNFLKTTTCVVLKNNFMSDYNDAIKNAVKSYWNITPTEFISESDFNKLRTDASKSFIVINQVYFEKDKTETLFDFLILTNGGKYKTVNDMPTLCGIPLSYNNEPETDYIYKLGLIIKFMQNHVQVCINNPNLNKDNIADYYIKLTGSPENKNFYVLKEEVSPELRIKTNFEKYYSYKYKFTSKEEITELINNNDKDAIILHKIGVENNNSLNLCIKIIIDTENAQIYYYDMHKMNKNNLNYILESDLKKLSKKK